jgi:hypothetical protein
MVREEAERGELCLCPGCLRECQVRNVDVSEPRLADQSSQCGALARIRRVMLATIAAKPSVLRRYVVDIGRINDGHLSNALGLNEILKPADYAFGGTISLRLEVILAIDVDQLLDLAFIP